MTSVELQLLGGPEYFRLAFDAPENMVWIEPGTFMMGSPEDEQDRWDDEGPQTEVTLTQGYFMGKYEVMQGEYLAVMGDNPSWCNGDRTAEGGQDYGTDLKRPVESVSWEDSMAYCEALTAQERAANRVPTGFAYRLPTEAEWEYACRAGTTTRFSYGDDPGYTIFEWMQPTTFGYTNLANYAWHSTNSEGATHSVGQKLPNPWGLFDMHGNICEWCLDGYAGYPGGMAVDPLSAPETGYFRVIRGGHWQHIALGCRSASRRDWSLDGKRKDCGFRVVLAPARP